MCATKCKLFVSLTLSWPLMTHVPLWLGWYYRYVVFLYLQWGLSLAPARSSSLAMGTLLVMIAISRGRRPSLFGVFRSSSSKLYWDKSSCTKSNSWCSTASNKASLLWNCDRKKIYMKCTNAFFALGGYIMLLTKVLLLSWSNCFPWLFLHYDVSGLTISDILSLTYYGGFAQPLLVSSPSWHHTILQARGVGAHTELSRQVAI